MGATKLWAIVLSTSAVACTNDFDALFKGDGQTVAATSCESADVQAAIDRALDGDTVSVPSGSCVWTSTVVIPDDKSVSLRGAGVGKTVIVHGGPTLLLTVEVAEGTFSRVTGFTFDQASLDLQSEASVAIESAGLDTFRVDNNQFTNMHDVGIRVSSVGGAEVSGVIDHNAFDCPSTTPTCRSVTVSLCAQGQGEPMNVPEALGSSRYVFFEDNVLSYSHLQDGGLDGIACSRYVARFNEYHGASQGHHGNDGGSRRGTHSYEIYRNTFDTQGLVDAWTGRVHSVRSGTGLIFDNQYELEVEGGLDYQIYRVSAPYPIFGKCDGSSDWDGNDGSGSTYPAAGWPCIDSPGWVFDALGGKPGGSYHRAPAYAFGNRRGASSFVGTSGDPTHVAEDAEFFNEKAAFDGTSGVGIGTKAELDSTVCTTEFVGFWVTDEADWSAENGSEPDGRLYVCRAGAWTPYYTPFAYPHPLQTKSD